MVEVINKTTKCAEIHCSLSAGAQFHIKCICGITFLDYDSFQRHFHTDHIKSHINDSTTTTVGNGGLPHELESSDAVESSLCTDELNKKRKCQTYKARNKTNTCTYCGRSFRRRYLLETHINIHTGHKPHQCELCGKQFRAISTLTRHLRTHKERQSLQCQHCEKVFYHRGALLSHELRHTQVRRWACGQCEKSFYTPNQLDTHTRKLHVPSGEPQCNMKADDLPYSCELCSNSYRSASTLSTHKLKKHYRLAKFCCEYCDKKFVDTDHLQKHQQIHKKPEKLL